MEMLKIVYTKKQSNTLYKNLEIKYFMIQEIICKKRK